MGRTHRLLQLVSRHPDELATDLLAVGVAKTMRLPLVTGLPGLGGRDRDVAVVVLPRRTP
ncbi:MAG: hypothetical protein ACKVWR_04210 [Acidimicrobiales bacterium]